MSSCGWWASCVPRTDLASKWRFRRPINVCVPPARAGQSCCTKTSFSGRLKKALQPGAPRDENCDSSRAATPRSALREIEAI